MTEPPMVDLAKDAEHIHASALAPPPEAIASDLSAADQSLS